MKCRVLACVLLLVSVSLAQQSLVIALKQKNVQEFLHIANDIADPTSVNYRSYWTIEGIQRYLSPPLYQKVQLYNILNFIVECTKGVASGINHPETIELNQDGEFSTTGP